MKPYKFQPYLKTTIWGGYQIAPFKGIFNAQPNVGESWEISGVPGHESVAMSRGLIDDVDEGTVIFDHVAWAYNNSIVGGIHAPDGDKTGPFMHSSRFAELCEHEGVTALRLPYQGNGLEMVFVLPPKDQPLEAVVAVERCERLHIVGPQLVDGDADDQSRSKLYVALRHHFGRDAEDGQQGNI